MHTNQPVAACEAMEKALVCLQEVGSEAQTRLAHHQWEAHEILGQLYFSTQRYQDSYQHYLALPHKPEGSHGWPRFLSVCALAIELKDSDRVPSLLARLLAHPDAPLGMFFFELSRAQCSGARRCSSYASERNK